MDRAFVQADRLAAGKSIAMCDGRADTESCRKNTRDSGVDSERADGSQL